MSHKMTTPEFITKAIFVHGSKFQYNKVKYISNHIKVLITCPEHGDFEQTPTGHLSGKGCMKCSGKEKSSTESFITKAKEVHGSTYQYNNVNYIWNKQKVLITCPVHGDFEQTPSSHLCGAGCKKCSLLRKYAN